MGEIVGLRMVGARTGWIATMSFRMLRRWLELEMARGFTLMD